MSGDETFANDRANTKDVGVPDPKGRMRRMAAFEGRLFHDSRCALGSPSVRQKHLSETTVLSDDALLGNR